MADLFPFGQDWSQKDYWLGTFTSISQRWTVSYDGNLSVICGHHSFIFLGLDSLTIALVSPQGCGPSIGVPIGRLFGMANPSQAREIEKAWDGVEQVHSTEDNITRSVEHSEITRGTALLERMNQAIPPKTYSSHTVFTSRFSRFPWCSRWGRG